jgi:hypothetical protein
VLADTRLVKFCWDDDDQGVSLNGRRACTVGPGLKASSLQIGCAVLCCATRQASRVHEYEKSIITATRVITTHDWRRSFGDEMREARLFYVIVIMHGLKDIVKNMDN